jgi:hypothetical protein
MRQICSKKNKNRNFVLKYIFKKYLKISC